MNITLNEDQKKAKNAFIAFLLNPEQQEFVIEGFAGTGKTTLIKYMIGALDALRKSTELLGQKIPEFEEIAVTATTRKAATVLADSMNTDPLTIHSYLGLVLKNNYRTGEQELTLGRGAAPKENSLIIIDEASFIDNELKEYIQDLTYGCKVVYMGDPCQLISVNTDISPIFGQGIPTAKLRQIMRHDGPISDISALYRNTVETKIFKPFVCDGTAVRHVNGPTFQSEIDAAFTSAQYKADNSCKVLAWRNDRVSEYNEYIADERGIHEPYPAGEYLITNKPIISAKQEVMYSTDKPVLIERSTPSVLADVEGYDVTLSCGFTMFCPTERWKVKQLLRRMAKEKEWKSYFEIKDFWGDLRPAYASTVHKSQGSTYEKVFIDLTDLGYCQNPDDVARLLYVAVSRASKEVVMCGELPQRYLTGDFNEYPESA
ncbi:ATP-dependent DNA helicase [Alteromonas sp. RKMC-009]|uniref:ATP-dependent DNA helicase n=1 Tax=Alteromonas sp. RKMC-009 TaxID=2267264 RepID=UPI000E67A52A|nr:AAA family ATPase [Alteromonas sp. RKMC-009]AYA64281.1 hypothetical protein DS731_09900 [Alteromonas sp. RKMC-009]